MTIEDWNKMNTHTTKDKTRQLVLLDNNSSISAVT
jgi:hypothetical protein